MTISSHTDSNFPFLPGLFLNDSDKKFAIAGIHGAGVPLISISLFQASECSTEDML